MWDAAPGGSGWSKTLPPTSAGRGTGDTPFLVPVARAISASLLSLSYSYTHYVSLSVPSPLQLGCPCSPHPHPQNPNSLLLSASSRAQK